MNKRGSILDIFFLAVMVVALAIFFLILGKVVGDITTELQNSKLNESEAAMNALTYSANLTAQFDYVFLLIFMGLLIGVLVASALIHVHKIFIPVYIILFGISIVVGAIMNNVYEEFKENALLSATAAGNNFANAIIGNYVLVLIGVGVLSMILIFGKTRESGRL